MPEISPREARNLPWFVENFSSGEVRLAIAEWLRFARKKQYPLLEPVKDAWLVVGGRGSGKTRLGAEWVHAMARGLPPFTEENNAYGQIALVGETFADVREVMVEGPSGILTVSREVRPRFEPSRKRLLWESTGAVAQMFSSEDPESLRGPQFGAAWCDELAKWKNAEATWDMLQFGLRLGKPPRLLVTTTPKPVPLVKRLMADPAVTKTHMRTDENAENLAARFLETVRERYGGTRLGRQELDGELIEDREDALWTREAIEAAALRQAQDEGEASGLTRIVVAVDPPASARKTSDACGIVAAGLDGEGRAVVLADATLRAASPQGWATRAVGLYHSLKADCIVAEVNQGGDMVTAVIRAVDAGVPVKPVRARRGKWLRAEPVAALYAQGRVRHAGRFPELEDEMCDFGPGGLSGGRSPDRVDALVWAVSELMLGRADVPRVRGM